MRNSFFVVFLVVLLGIFFNNILFSDKSFFAGDIIAQFRAWKVFASENMQAGEIPLWNPYCYGGSPFLANLQSAVFYPPGIVFYIFGFCPALKIFILLHFFLAGFFVFLLCEHLDLDGIASSLSAVVFIFNGYFVTRIEFLSLLSACIWLPLLMLLVLSCPEKFRSTSIATLIFAFFFLAGYPQVLFYSLLFLTGWVAVRDGCKWKRIRLIVFGCLAGMFLAAVQFVPTFEFIRAGWHSSAISWHALSLEHIPNLICPVSNRSIDDNFWLSCFYIGIVPFALSMMGIAEKKDRLGWFMAGTILAACFLALDVCTPLFSVITRYFPLFRMFRCTTTVMFLAVSSFSILSGFGIDAMRSSVLVKGILLIVVIAELFLFGIGINPVVGRGYLKEKPEILDYIEGNTDEFTVFLTPKTYNTRWQWRIKHPGRWKEYKEFLFPNMNMSYHIREINGYDTMRLASFEEIYSKIGMSGSLPGAQEYLDVFNCKYILNIDNMKNPDYVIVKKGIPNLYEYINFKPAKSVMNKDELKRTAAAFNAGLFITALTLCCCGVFLKTADNL